MEKQTQYYEDSSSTPYLERAILMQDIELILVNKGKELSLEYFDPEKVGPSKTEETDVDVNLDVTVGDEHGSATGKITIPALEVVEEEPTSNPLCAYDNKKIYKLQYDYIDDIIAKFYIPILMPTIDPADGNPVEKSASAPSSVGVKSASGRSARSYTTTNYVNLRIPRYIVWQYCGKDRNFIPKGTEFLIANVGGKNELEAMRIIGIYSFIDYE